MLLACGDALIDFLPVKSVDGRDAAVPVWGGPVSTSPSAWRA